MGVLHSHRPYSYSVTKSQMASRSLVTWRRSILTFSLRLIMVDCSPWGAPTRARAPLKVSCFFYRRVRNDVTSPCRPGSASSRCHFGLAYQHRRRRHGAKRTPVFDAWQGLQLNPIQQLIRPPRTLIRGPGRLWGSPPPRLRPDYTLRGGSGLTRYNGFNRFV